MSLGHRFGARCALMLLHCADVDGRNVEDGVNMSLCGCLHVMMVTLYVDDSICGY